MENDKCALCSEYSSRLIKESCGHSKCRNCFIEDEFGCRNCLNSSQIVSKQHHEEALLPLIIETNDIQLDIISNSQSKEDQNGGKHLTEEVTGFDNGGMCAIGINSKTLSKQKVTRPTKIPSHVIRLTNTYKCTVCDKEFSSRSQQYYHLYCNESSKKPFCCRLCPKRFSSSYHLKYHEESHSSSQTLKCPECCKIFTRRVTLRQHLKQHERSCRLFACSVCEAKFKDKYTYRAHSDKHNNVFRFSCQSCEKKFSLKSTFKKHQIVHCNQKAYECSNCKKTFKRKDTYKAHLSHHSDKKHFSCDQCSKSFADLKTLQRHKKIHESKFYKCAFCSVKSKRKDNLSRHMRNMHPHQKSVAIVQDLSEEIATEVLPESVASSNHTEEMIMGSTSSEAIAVGTHLPKEPERYLQCSVIKSVGNAKPVLAFGNDDCKVQESAANQEVNEGSIGLNSVLKKRKKKYDPCEIYRKILLGSNDEDSMLESTQIEPHQEETTVKKTENNLEVNAPSNFAEIHWRKRTSQYFSSINV